MVPVTEMDPVFVRKALMDSVVVPRTVKEIAMRQLSYVHHVRKDFMEIFVSRDVHIIVKRAVLRVKENVINVLKDTGKTSVIKVRNIFIRILQFGKSQSKVILQYHKRLIYFLTFSIYFISM